LYVRLTLVEELLKIKLENIQFMHPSVHSVGQADEQVYNSSDLHSSPLLTRYFPLYLLLFR